MRVSSLAALLALAHAPLWAQVVTTEQARVIRKTPVVQNVAVARDVCRDEQVAVPGRTSGAGAVIGSIAGGAMGNALGNGGGRDLATAIGLVGGAILGNQIERREPNRIETVRRCSTETAWEPRTVGYDVVYEYAGKQYSTQLAQDPGDWLPLQIGPAAPAAQPVTVTPPPVRVIREPARVVTQYVPAPVWTSAVVVQPASVWGGHHFGHGHGHNARHGNGHGWGHEKTPQTLPPRARPIDIWR